MAHTRRYALEVPSAVGNGADVQFEGIIQATVQVSGSNDGTINLEGSNDGTTWSVLAAALVNGGPPVAVSPLPVLRVRIAVSGWTSGDSTCAIDALE